MKKRLFRVCGLITICTLLLCCCDLLNSMNGNNTPPDEEEAPGTPTGLAVSGTPTKNSISLLWSAVSGAEGYRLYRDTSQAGSYTKMGSDITGTSYTDTGLSSNTTYYYEVSAYNDKGESSKSAALEAKTASDGGCPSDHDGKTYVAKIGETSYTDVGFPAVPDDARFFSYGPVYVGSDNYLYYGSGIPNKHFVKDNNVPAIPTNTEFFSSDKYNSGIYFYLAGTKIYSCDSNDIGPAWTEIANCVVPSNTKFFNVANRMAFCVDTNGTVRIFHTQNDSSWQVRSFLAIPTNAIAFYGKNQNDASYADSTGKVYHYNNDAYYAVNVPSIPVSARAFIHDGSLYVSPLNSESVTYIDP